MRDVRYGMCGARGLCVLGGCVEGGGGGVSRGLQHGGGDRCILIGGTARLHLAMVVRRVSAVVETARVFRERSLKTPEGVGVYCYIISLIFFKQSRRESLVVTYALDEVCLASADGFVNGTEALFELGAR